MNFLKNRLAKQFRGFCKTNQLFLESPIKGVSLFYWKKERQNESLTELPTLPDRLVLGKRAERFFSEWIQQNMQYTVLEEGLQLFEGKATLGEFDFLLREIESKRLIHLEMVYKFYLFDKTHPKQWIGPNRRDFIQLKLNKLAMKQFPLLYSNQGKEQLLEVGISETEIQQELLFLAKLFVPFNQPYELERLNQEAVQGYWFRLNDFMDYLGESLSCIPEKQDWLQEGDVNAEWRTPRSIREELIYHLTNKRSPMVWIKRKNHIEQAFVVWWNEL